MNPGDPHTHNKFVQLHKAYSVLNDPVRRQAYDQSLQLLHQEHHYRTSNKWKAQGSSTQRHEDSERTTFHDATIWWMREGGAEDFAANQAPITQRKRVLSLLECGLLVATGFALFFYSFKYVACLLCMLSVVTIMYWQDCHKDNYNQYLCTASGCLQKIPRRCWRGVSRM